MAKMPAMKTDNPFFHFMGKLGDVVLLNVTWLVCCLPVATIGASTTALFYVARKISANEEYRIWHDFSRSFRSNWKQATVLWLVLLAAGALAVADLWIGLHTDSSMGNIWRGVGGVLLLVWMMAGLSFPLLARYHYQLRRLVIDALRLAATKPYITVVHVLLIIWLPALLFIDPNLFMFCLPLWVLVGGAASAVAVTGLLLPVQKEIEGRQQEKGEE